MLSRIALSFDKLWFNRPGGYSAPYRIRLPTPTTERSSSRSASPCRDPTRGWDDLATIKPVTPPLSLSTCERFSEADDTTHEKRSSFTEPQIVQYPFLFSSVLPRPSAIEVRGLDDGFQHPIDFYQPVIRRFHDIGLSASNHSLNTLRHPPVIEPIDTVTMWKGLTLDGCETLLLIQKYTKACQEQLLEDQFISLKTRLRNARQSTFQDSWAMPDCMETVIPYRFRFYRAQLVQAVTEALEMTADPYESRDGRHSDELLMLYLWSRDCLVDLPNQAGYTAMNARFRCSMDAGAYCPSSSTVEALWTPDHVSFEALDVLPQEGSEIVIKPHYHANAPRRPGDPFTLVTYSLESNHPWLHWYDEAGAFQGQVPRFSQSPSVNSGLGQVTRTGRQGSHAAVHNVAVEIKAFVVVSYRGSAVCLERTIRVRVSLRVLPAVVYPSPTQLLYPYPAGLEGRVSWQSQAQHVHRMGNSVCLHHDVNANPGLVLNTNQQDPEVRLNPTSSANLAAGNVKPSSKNTISNPPHASTNTQDLKISTPEHKADMKGHPDGQNLPPSGKKKASSGKRVLSNISGIGLEAFALIQLNPNDPVLGEGYPSSTDKQGQSEGFVTSKERYYEEDEAFNAQHTPRRSKEKTDRFWDRATGFPRDIRPENQTPRTGSRRIQRCQGYVRTPDRPQICLRVDESVPDADCFNNHMTSACKRKIRSAQDLHSSLKRRQDRSSKFSTLDEGSVLIQYLGGNEPGYRSSQRAREDQSPSKQESYIKCHRNPLLTASTPSKNPALGDMGSADSTLPSTPPRKSEYAPQDPKFNSDTPQTVIFSNRYAPLQNLPSGSSREPSSNSSDFELFLGAAAQGLFELDRRSGQAGPPHSSACHLQDVFRDVGEEIILPLQESDEFTSCKKGSSATSGSRNGKGMGLYLFNATPDTKSLELDPTKTATGRSSCSSPYNARDPPSPPSSTRSTSTTSYHDGGSPERTAEEKDAALRISIMKEAVEACRERCLSNDERAQMFEAFKKSLPSAPAISGSSALYRMESVVEDDDGVTESELEFVDGRMASSEVDSEDLEQDPEEF